jgi:hypothetical protein
MKMNKLRLLLVVIIMGNKEGNQNKFKLLQIGSTLNIEYETLHSFKAHAHFLFSRKHFEYFETFHSHLLNAPRPNLVTYLDGIF